MLSYINRLPSLIVSEVFHQGKRIHGNAVEIVASKGKADVSRFAFVVSTSVDKRATERNRLRRIASEYIRLHMNDIHGVWDVVVVMRSKAKVYSSPQLREALRAVLSGLT